MIESSGNKIPMDAAIPDGFPVKPAAIQGDEFGARVDRAQTLMRESGFRALVVEPGASLRYFTGVNWWRSERLTCAIIPAEGSVTIITPFMEEPSVRESLAVPAQVRTWLEHEEPMALLAGVIHALPGGKGAIAVDETCRYFIVDGLQTYLPGAAVINGASITRPCRMLKSPAEIALMQHATDITIAAYRYTVPRVQIGMQPEDITNMMKTATVHLGGVPEFEIALIGEAASYPHGSNKPQFINDGDLVLMDCGCSVDGYQSDVSRTFVVGTPSALQQKVWNEVQQGQQVAFRSAKPGVAAGSVDDAVRRFYDGLGYGPGYQLPGLTHRTGHGIGLDGHEPINLVGGETMALQPGMCFSNEPGIYIPGEFGVRIEDCFYMTDEGPKWFSTPPRSLEQPV